MTSATLERTQERTPSGAFRRTREPWTPDRWDDGYVDNRGRFRVYRPDCPRAYAGGYALRAHVVWWLAHGEAHPRDADLHHVNGVRLDDRIDNLVVEEHVRHAHLHNAATVHEFVCEHCDATFELSADAVGKRRREGKTPRFCKQACYHAHPKSDGTRRKVGASLRLAYQEGRR